MGISLSLSEQGSRSERTARRRLIQKKKGGYAHQPGLRNSKSVKETEDLEGSAETDAHLREGNRHPRPWLAWIGPVLSAHQNIGTITSESLGAGMWAACRGKLGECQVQSVHGTAPSEVQRSYLACAKWVSVCTPMARWCACTYSTGIPLAKVSCKRILSVTHEFQGCRGLWLEDRKLCPALSHVS